MTLEEKLEHGKKMLLEAIEENDNYGFLYWRGYVDGVRVAMEKEENV